MSNIPSQFNPSGLSSRQNALSDAQFSSYVRQQSVSAHESLNAGLTIKTKEGDLVTLNSNSYAQLDAYSYNSKGVVQTEDGTAVVKQNHREITLSSGESFSFSIVGDLNEQELEDIEDIVKNIDGIIEEMAQGDMDDAVALALNMGGYDSVSEYSADISYEKSYSQTTQTQATQATLEDPHTSLEHRDMPAPSYASDSITENTQPWRQINHSVENFSKLIEKIAEQLEGMEEKQLAKAKDPVDTLFAHHLGKVKNNNGNGNSGYNVLNEARKQVEKMIEKMTSQVFDQQLSSMLDQ